MNPAILDFATLKAVTGYERQADVERCLTKAGIRFFFARGGVWTTLDLVNAAGGLLPSQEPARAEAREIVTVDEWPRIAANWWRSTEFIRSAAVGFTGLIDQSGPGIYVALGSVGEILYVGKTKCLRSRIYQHWNYQRAWHFVWALPAPEPLITYLEDLYMVMLRPSENIRSPNDIGAVYAAMAEIGLAAPKAPA